MMGIWDKLTRSSKHDHVSKLIEEIRRETEQNNTWEKYAKTHSLDLERCVYICGSYGNDTGSKFYGPLIKASFIIGQCNIGGVEFLFDNGYHWFVFEKPEDATFFRMKWNV